MTHDEAIVTVATLGSMTVISVRGLATQQAVYVPIGAMLALIVFGFTVPGYSSISQHLSELGLLPGLPPRAVQAASGINGAAIVIFSLSLLTEGRRFALTSLTSTIFGVAMLSNGVFTIGSPLHGLYGIGMFSVLTPLFFLVELGTHSSTRIRWVSCWTSLLGMAYVWFMVTGQDPPSYHGLTQRIALLPAFGWYTFAALELRRQRS